MFGINLYNTNEEDEKKENDNFNIIDKKLDDDYLVKKLYFDKLKNHTIESTNDSFINKEDDIETYSDRNCCESNCPLKNDYEASCPLNKASCKNCLYNTPVYSVNEEEHMDDEIEKINYDDDDEDEVDKLYIITIDDIPYYYENDLPTARSKMWSIANNLVKNDNNNLENSNNYIFTNNLNKVSLISPYSFFGLNYHYTICELSIEYVIRYNK